VPLDARRDGRAIPTRRKEHPARRFADGGLSAAQSERTHPDSRGRGRGDLESMAINIYLSEKYEGPMHSGGAEALGLATQWSIWAMLEMEQLLLDLLMHRALLPEFSRDPSCAARDELLLQRPLGVLNAALKGREFLAAGGFAVADLNVASILAWGKMARLGLSDQPELKRWLDVCLARPAYRRVRDLGRRTAS
jgi:glutathione S-transferase